jgi:hypothetical protein
MYMNLGYISCGSREADHRREHALSVTNVRDDGLVDRRTRQVVLLAREMSVKRR